MKVCVALTRPESELYGELGEMVADALSELGVEPALVEDGDAGVLEADGLLLLGDAHGSDGFARLLSAYEGRRPATALWQLEPLPPPDLSEEAERIGSRASRMADRLESLPGPVVRLIRSLTSEASRRRVREAVGRALLSGFDRETGEGPDAEFERFDALSYRSMMRQHVSLKRRLAEGWVDHVFVSNLSKKEFLARQGVRAEFAPVGYHPLMGEDLGASRDIDVVFLGTVNLTRREKILEFVQRELAPRGLELVLAGEGCFGDRRSELLNRARVSLSLASHPNETQGLRFLMSMGCGALVVSEPLYDPAPFRAGEHFVEAGVLEMPRVIASYLSREAERRAVVRSARDFITLELTMGESMKRIMGVLSADSPVSSGDIRGGR